MIEAIDLDQPEVQSQADYSFRTLPAEEWPAKLGALYEELGFSLPDPVSVLIVAQEARDGTILGLLFFRQIWITELWQLDQDRCQWADLPAMIETLEANFSPGISFEYVLGVPARVCATPDKARRLDQITRQAGFRLIDYRFLRKDYEGGKE